MPGPPPNKPSTSTSHRPIGAEDLVALTERFGSGRLKARDLTRIIGAGLRGAGAAVTDDDVAVMAVEGGAQGYVRIAAELIQATFGETGA